MGIQDQHTCNFRLRFYCPLYLLPISYDDSLYRWLVYVKVSITSVVLLYLSEFRLIQPQVGISVLPLPKTRSKELLLYVFRKYILQLLSQGIVNIKPNTNSPQVSEWITLWASKVYPLFGQSHTELITLYTFRFPNCQKTFVSIKRHIISIMEQPKIQFYFIINLHHRTITNIHSNILFQI